ncbi:MAG: thiamine diphosphokinase [Eubacterium sp.]|nr:thiamine diphosphokinase [Eubacterium sp.]
MVCLIIAGGTISPDQLKTTYDRISDDALVLTADRGTLHAISAGIPIDRAIGDFDSVDGSELALIKEKLPDKVEKLIPEKDDTDTEHALRYAFEHNPSEIIMMGCTGTRLDQTINSIFLLRECADRGIPAFIIDSTNRIRISKGTTQIKKENLFGKYISILPLEKEAHIKTISGFKYDVTDITLSQSSGRGISNELVEEEGIIESDDHIIIIESID